MIPFFKADACNRYLFFLLIKNDFIGYSYIKSEYVTMEEMS